MEAVWGIWFMVTLGATAGAVLLVVGLAFGGWPVLVALAIFAVVGAVVLGGASWRRSREYVEGGDEGRSATSAESSGGSDPSRGAPQSGGAPASGEGG